MKTEILVSEENSDIFWLYHWSLHTFFIRVYDASDFELLRKLLHVHRKFPMKDEMKGFSNYTFRNIPRHMTVYLLAFMATVQGWCNKMDSPL